MPKIVRTQLLYYTLQSSPTVFFLIFSLNNKGSKSFPLMFDNQYDTGRRRGAVETCSPHTWNSYTSLHQYTCTLSLYKYTLVP